MTILIGTSGFSYDDWVGNYHCLCDFRFNLRFNLRFFVG